MSNKVGRPLKWPTPELLQQEIDRYFAETPMSHWTITGLALALDTDRHTLINYSEREEYFHTINKAKLMVENAYEIDFR